MRPIPAVLFALALTAAPAPGWLGARALAQQDAPSAAHRYLVAVSGMT
jgi:hypothetical protein